jgi:3-hydroxyisobutyrate dehydrogenase-like beta-hydroxyacid dehydrogenase
MKIGFIGLGNMGWHMARHLVGAGQTVTVWNRTSSRAEGLQRAGAGIAASPADAAEGAEAVITMLADDFAVGSAVFDEGGFIDALSAGSVHISMSTISVALSKKLAEEHRKREQNYMSAPVFGRPEAAEAGKLFIVAAGKPSVVERYKAVLELLGQRLFIIGDKPEKANVVKLSGNFLIASVIESLGEAVALVRKYDVAPGTYIDFLTNSLFTAPVYKTYGNLIAEEKYQPAGFKLRMGLKDIKLALAAGEVVDAALPFASVVRDHLLTAIARGMEELDWSSTAKLAAENAGLK